MNGFIVLALALCVSVASASTLGGLMGKTNYQSRGFASKGLEHVETVQAPALEVVHQPHLIQQAPVKGYQQEFRSTYYQAPQPILAAPVQQSFVAEPLQQVRYTQSAPVKGFQQEFRAAPIQESYVKAPQQPMLSAPIQQTNYVQSAPVMSYQQPEFISTPQIQESYPVKAPQPILAAPVQQTSYAPAPIVQSAPVKEYQPAIRSQVQESGLY